MSNNDTPETNSDKPEIFAVDPERDLQPTIDMQVNRTRALEAYASVESSLASLFSTLLNTNPKLAGIVFYRIINSRSRNIIIEDLIKENYKSKYNLFWNPFINIIKLIDADRNIIVHWHPVKNIHINDDWSTTSKITLAPPNFWKRNNDTPEIGVHDLVDFQRKCRFAEHALLMFELFITDHFSGDERQTWSEIFQQPITFPPPDTHPLSPNYKEPESPPPPSPG